MDVRRRERMCRPLIERLANLVDNLFWLNCANAANIVDDAMIGTVRVPAPWRLMIAKQRHASRALAGGQMHGAAVVPDKKHGPT